jgi:hypothetical protein
VSLLLSIIVYPIVVYAIFFDRKARKKSPEVYRRERAYHRAERAATCYAALPAARKAFDAEKRERKMRKRAKAAVSWAILAEQNFSHQEADGAILLALHRDKTLAQDTAKLHEAALSILKTATCQ